MYGLPWVGNWLVTRVDRLEETDQAQRVRSERVFVQPHSPVTYSIYRATNDKLPKRTHSMGWKPSNFELMNLLQTR